MHTDGIGGDPDIVTLDRLDDALSNPSQRARHNGARVVEAGTGLAAGNKRAVGPISTVCEELVSTHVRDGERFQHATLRHEKLQGITCAPDRVDERSSLFGVGRDPVVQRTVGFDISNGEPEHLGPGLQGSNLTRDGIRERLAVDVHGHAPEACAILISHVGTDRHGVGLSERERGVHGLLVSGVGSAGDVRTREVREHSSIVAESLTEIRIEVDVIPHAITPKAGR